MKYIIIATIALCSFAYADDDRFPYKNIQWTDFHLKSEVDDKDDNLIKNYFMDETMDLEKPKNNKTSSFVFATLDVNSDSINDVLIVIKSSLYCGSDGCSSWLLIGKENNEYVKVNFPATHASVAENSIGIHQGVLYIDGGRGKCDMYTVEKKAVKYLKYISC